MKAILFSAITVGVLLLVGAWVVSTVNQLSPTAPLVAWTLGSTVLVSLLATNGGVDRLGSLVLAGALVVSLPSRLQSVRGAFLLVGVPWIALFVAGSIDLVGHFSIYSADDWLTYQVAGYRIFMGGYWLEGGSPAFDYQPLYRWISGFLHLVFGDSSVGEVYFDAACLLVGALIAFELVQRYSGFRFGLAAAVGTLATFSLGTPWHFIGRGLSEIAAAGFGFLTAFFVLRASTGHRGAALAAGLFAVLMFYTRLNHLVFAPFLLALLIPIHPMTDRTDAWRSLRRVVSPAVVFGIAFFTGVALFAVRTWWYTGVLSLLQGTSLRHNDTGLRLTTMFNEDVWRRIAHSLNALLWMNEPPAPDLRAALVMIGTALSVGAIVRLPPLRRLPTAIACVVVGATASSFFAHTHNYPGRMSIHLVPFAAAMTMCAVSQFAPFRARQAPAEGPLRVVA